MERIYTIPVNEAFETGAADPKCGCPMCLLTATQEEREIELILGASMMEPDIRIETNRKGFCKRHFEMMLPRRNRLGLALILESHLAEVIDGVTEPGLVARSSRGGVGPVQYMDKLEHSCYICDRINSVLDKMSATVCLLWEDEREFRDKLSRQSHFCLPHYRSLLFDARRRMHKKNYSEFYAAIRSIELPYLDKLKGDISHFCKKFDYRFEEEPWYDSKDAIERTIATLCADEGKPSKN